MEEKEFVRSHHNGSCKFFMDFMELTFGDE